MLWVFVITVLANSLMLLVLQNFKNPEKVLARKASIAKLSPIRSFGARWKLTYLLPRHPAGARAYLM
jgi:hypothetical protein